MSTAAARFRQAGKAWLYFQAAFMTLDVMLLPGTWKVAFFPRHTETLHWVVGVADARGLNSPEMFAKFQPHPLICLTHLLPPFIWASLAPIQLSPSLRHTRPSLHRLLGYTFSVAAAAIAVGFVLIDWYNLYYASNIWYTKHYNRVHMAWFVFTLALAILEARRASRQQTLGRQRQGGLRAERVGAPQKGTSTGDCEPNTEVLGAQQQTRQAGTGERAVGRNSAGSPKTIVRGHKVSGVAVHSEGGYVGHRKWMIRHLAAGGAVVFQRLLLGAMPLYHELGWVDTFAEEGKRKVFGHTAVIALVVCTLVTEAGLLVLGWKMNGADGADKVEAAKVD